MGAVFLADDLELDRKVAIKVLPATESNDSTLVERFRREARTAAKLDHPNIIPIYRVESSGNLHYFVMRYVPGRTLDDTLADEPKLEIDQVRSILAQAARALGHAHQRSIVHRDVKPANIMLDADQVVLTDFGISKSVQATTNLTNTGMIIGTPSYMAPEQGRGQPVDGRADQYALGIVGYQMLTGTLPFEADDVFALMFKQMHEPPPPIAGRRPAVPPGLARAIERALAKAPAERFSSMEEFARAVEATGPMEVPTELVALPVDWKARPAPKRTPRWPWLAGMSLVGLTIAVVLGQLGRTKSRQASLNPPSPVEAVATQPSPAPLPPPAAPVEDSVAAGAPPPAPEPPDRRPARPPALQPPPPPPPAFSGPPRVERAMVTIGVDGSFATVYLDNELLGETPVVRELGFGEHEIRLEREGFKTIRQKIHVSGPMTRRFTLEPAGPP
jgi:serine/threonine-protein kinase